MKRDWQNHYIFPNEAYTHREAWESLISLAVWDKTKLHLPGTAKVIELQRGQLTYSIQFLANRWGWRKAKAQRFLNKLKNDAMIHTVNATEKNTRGNTQQQIITICNYNKYQSPNLAKNMIGDTVIDTPIKNQRYQEEGTEIIEVRGNRFSEFKSHFPKERAGNWEKVEVAYQAAISRGNDESKIIAGTIAYENSGEVKRGFAKGPTEWLNDDRFNIDYKLLKEGKTHENNKRINNRGYSNRPNKSERARNAAREAVDELNASDPIAGADETNPWGARTSG